MRGERIEREREGLDDFPPEKKKMEGKKSVDEWKGEEKDDG